MSSAKPTEYKANLKQGKKLLLTKQFREALDIFQPLMDANIVNPDLFALVGFAHANLENYKDAQELYEKTLEIEPSNVTACRGLLQLYDQEEIDLDSRGLEICEKIEQMEQIGDDAKKAVHDLRRRIWLKIDEYNDLYNDLGDDPDLLADIVDKLGDAADLTKIEAELLAEAYSRLRPKYTGGNNFVDYWGKYCKYLYKSDKAYRNEVVDYVSKIDQKDEWFSERCIEFTTEDYFLQKVVQDDRLLQNLNENCGPDHLKSLHFLKHLKEDDINLALELLDQLSYKQIITYPTCLIASRLYEKIENWEQLIKVLCSYSKKHYFPPEIKVTQNWLIVKGNLELDGTVPDNKLIDECCSSDSIPAEFLRERIILGKTSKINNETWKMQLTQTEKNRVRFIESFYSKDYVNAVEEGNKLVELSEVNWADLVDLAEARIALQQDCVPLLVKAAKLAPRSSRAFYMLGKSIQNKSLVKAKGCLERAVKIRPMNPEYVRALDDLLIEAKEKPEIRLALLKPLAIKVREKWLNERIAELSYFIGDYETATTVYQRLVRESAENTKLWAKLAEIYTKKGHFNSAVSAYEQVLKLQPQSGHHISLIGLMIRLRKDEQALEHCAAWRKNHGEHEVAKFVDILETMAHLRLSLSCFGEEKIEHVRQAIALLSPVLANKPNFALPHKLAGDILLQVSWYNMKYFDLFKIGPEWEVTSTNVLEKATHFYATALQFCKENILAWSDLAISLMLQAQQTGEPEPALNAAEIIKKAITLTEFNSTKSTFWTLLGEARRLSMESFASQQHCYIRALQLNKANDEAWLRLSLVHLETRQNRAAHYCVETALKYNPKSPEAWCVWASLAEQERNIYEATAMYKQSLIIKSMVGNLAQKSLFQPIALTHFTAITCTEMKETREIFDTSSVLGEFSEIFEIYYSSQTNEHPLLLSHLGVLAELFGHYTEAITCHKEAGANSSDRNLQRVLLKEGESVQISSTLKDSWVKMAQAPAEQLLEAIKMNSIYGELFKCLKEDDEQANNLWQLFSENRKKISMPLLISAIILFDIKLTDAAIQVIHDVLPRHELVDVFPPILPEGMDNELQYLEEDGEEPFRYRSQISKKLYEELLKRRGEAIEK